MRSKKVIAVAAAVGAGVLLAGCGGSGKPVADGSVTQPQNSAAPTTAAQPSASASASPTAGTAEVSNLRARMLAVAGVLQPKDFPGYTTEVQQEDETDRAFDAAVYKCLGVKQPVYLAENPGKSYKKDALEITSSVDVARTAEEALADLRVFTTAKGEACLKETSEAIFETMGVTVSGLEVTMSPTTVKGADEAFKVWMSMNLSGPGGEASISGWTVGAVVGGTQIGMDVSSEDGNAPGPERAIELAEIAVQRVLDAQKAPESDEDPEVAHLGKATGPQLGA